MSKNIYTEEEMISLLKNKDVVAFNVLYENYSAALYGIVSSIIPPEEIAQDILQDVFVKIWKSIEMYDKSKGRLYTWMLNIARNSAIDYARSKQFKLENKIQDIDNSVYEMNKQTSTTFNADTIGVKEEVIKLKDDYRVLIDFIYFKGYTQEETAKELNIPLGTVKTRVRAAIIELRKTIK